MLPTNVMSFMKKIVTTNENVPGSDTNESGTALSKLRQTLSSGLMTAQDKVTKLSPARQTQATDAAPIEDTTASTKTEEATTKSQKAEPGKPPSRSGTCRVCLKNFKPDDIYKTCFECQQKVCEDCASYSKQDSSEDETSWRCSICRRKLQSRVQPIITQESTDSLLDVPIVEALQRRHSDLKIGSGGNTSGFGLALPRSNEFRRHSDVSSASAKDLAKVQSGYLLKTGGGGGGGLGSGLAPPRSPELRRHSDVSPASLKELEKVAGERREELRWEREMEWRQHKRGSVSPQPPPEKPEESEEYRLQRNRTRRKSRVQKQHSYDDEMKGPGVGQGPAQTGDIGLGLPAQLPRRASAYDVFAVREAGGGMNPSRQQEGLETGLQGRRPSFRRPSGLHEFGNNNHDDKPVFDTSQSPLSPEGTTGSGLSVEDDRRSRRRSSQLTDLQNRGGAVLITPTSTARSSVSDVGEPPMRRQTSVADGEAIKIVIHDVDSDTGFNSRPGSKRRVILRRDPSDKGHRTRGFGMRVVGGKTGNDGRLFAYIVWTVPGGPAEKAGLQQGDKVLEWDGVSLVDRSFEEVCAVMDRTGEKAELFVEHATDLYINHAHMWNGISLGEHSGLMDTKGTLCTILVIRGLFKKRMCDLLDDPGSGPRKGDALCTQDVDQAPTSPTRRKLPKTPEQLARERQVSGRVQLQVFYHDEKQELVVSVLAADDLAPREDTGYGCLPEAVVKVRLLPSNDEKHKKSEIAEPSQNPIWNATFDFPNIPGEALMEKSIEVTLWDYCPDRESVFLGETTVELQKAFLEDRPTWYRLEDPHNLRQGGKSPFASPRGSLAGELAQRLVRRSDFGLQRSMSDDRESDEKSGSPELSLLHPDHAWYCGSRRGSSQSEVIEVEPYQLSRDYSHSLPGSRRSSFQKDQTTGEKEADIPPPTYNKGRRRSSCARVLQDPDEILRNLKAVKGELMGRKASLSGAHRRGSVDSINLSAVTKTKHRLHHTGSRDELFTYPFFTRHKERKESILGPPEQLIACSSPSDDEDRWRDEKILPDVTLGPGQIHPRGYRLTCGQGELKLGLQMTKGQLEVEIICARNIGCEARETLPDTYVKTYLRDSDRWLQKRKTRVVRHSNEPQFCQTLRYSACDVLGRTLLVMLWERQKGFEHNQGRGGVEIDLDKLQLTQLTIGWYPLFPIHSLGSDSNDSQ